MIFHRDLEANLHVCQNCGHHMRIPLVDRLNMLFDEGKYTRIAVPDVAGDPLKFRDDKKYTERLKEARSKTGERDAAIVAYGKLDEVDVVIAGLNFAFMGGSMGLAVGEALVSASELAVERNSPLIAITASGGARMQEGALSLMQMPRTVIAVQMVKEAGLPYIVLLTDPTTGGVSASFAMLGDVHITEPRAMIGFAGARVIEQTVRETLPEDFQTAEYLLEHGMVDIVAMRPELRKTLARVVGLLRYPRAETNETGSMLLASGA
tara:strand:+ start:4634 stop:5428 length:795 start_codon:yes stop_codon:yes gene_type:complete